MASSRRLVGIHSVGNPLKWIEPQTPTWRTNKSATARPPLIIPYTASPMTGDKIPQEPARRSKGFVMDRAFTLLS